MANTESDLERELSEYANRLIEAFDELHSAVLEKLSSPLKQQIPAHYNFPSISINKNSGFPTISEIGPFSSSRPLDYGRAFNPSLGGLITGVSTTTPDFSAGRRLREFINSSSISEKFGPAGIIRNYYLDRLIECCVDRYFHRYGTSPVEAGKRNRILRFVFNGTTRDILDVSLVCPIALTHFTFDHLRLTGTAYIARIPEKLQLARASVRRGGSGATEEVSSAATHAFVSSGWSIPKSPTEN